MELVEMNEIIQTAFRASAANLNELAKSSGLHEQVAKAAQMIIASYKRGGALFVCGNGGSAADSQHLVAELVSKLSKDRTPIRAFALTVDTSILTAIGNDYGYEFAFQRQVQGLMRENDILLVITTSGNSLNIIKAAQSCRKIGAACIALTGRDGGKIKAEVNHSIIVPNQITAQIQEGHLVIYHTLCYLIEKGLVAEGLCHYV